MLELISYNLISNSIHKMEAQKWLNDTICLESIKIQEEFPELVKYLNEMPEHLLPKSTDSLSIKDLHNYLDSLNKLFETYSKRHNKPLKQNT